MKILLVGSGGREHAIAQKLSQSPHQPELYFAPGNPGMESLGQRLEIDVMDIQGLRLFAQKENIDLTIIGPEAPLAEGIGDDFKKHGLLLFGPDKNGAQIEASKAFAKQLMQEAGVPTAGYRYCDTKEKALAALAEFTAPYVIKEDGLAAGKGVTVAQTKADAEQAIENAFAKQMPVIIEEFLAGEELSILAICDGQRAIPMIGAQDFKRLQDNNQGPNTGGMGAYAPVSIASPELIKNVLLDVLDKTMQAFNERGIDYRGVLYAGLMISPSSDNSGGKIGVIEFNCRFGDPETQVVLPLLDDDLVDILTAAANGDLSKYQNGFKFKNQHAVTVVLIAEGYPGTPRKGDKISIPEQLPEHTLLFHAGSKKMPDQSLTTNGGRIFNATGVGETLIKAREHAYKLAEAVQFSGKSFRSDIATKTTVSAL